MGQSLNELFEPMAERRRYSVRRSQLEIQMDILRVVSEGAYLPTQIMYRANLAWVSLQESLGTLVGNGLLDRVSEGSKRCYQLTTKGNGILTSFSFIVESLKVPRGQDRFGAS